MFRAKTLWSLCVVGLMGCSQWDKQPESVGVQRNQEREGFAEKWCGHSPSLPPEAQTTAQYLIDYAVDHYATDRSRAPEDGAQRCQWAAMRIAEQGKIDLSGSGVTDLRPLESFPSLNALSLRGLGLSPKQFDSVKKLSSLTELDLAGNPDLAPVLSLSEAFPHLQTLDLSEMSLQDASELHFESLRNLVRLSLQGNQLEALPYSLPPSLQILDLSQNKFSDSRELALLRQLPQLKKLSLKGNALTEVPDLPVHLEELDVLQNPVGRDEVLAEIKKRQKRGWLKGLVVVEPETEEEK